MAYLVYISNQALSFIEFGKSELFPYLFTDIPIYSGKPI